MDVSERNVRVMMNRIWKELREFLWETVEETIEEAESSESTLRNCSARLGEVAHLRH